jgi:hypothetical protein
MKSERAPEINRRPNIRAPSETFHLTKHLVGIWRDLGDNQRWKYDELSPVQLLEKLKPAKYLVDNSELERAEYFWSRRPRFLRLIGYVAWLFIALGLPFWLFIVPAIGVPLLIVSAVLANTEIVQSVRWRRQYELAIDRLIRTRSTFPGRKSSN